MKKAKNLISNLGEPPYYLQKDQRVTVRLDELSAFDAQINKLIGANIDSTEKITVSLASMKDKLSLANLNLQNINDVVNINLTPDNGLQVVSTDSNVTQVSSTALKYSFNSEDNFVGLQDVNLQFNINDISIQNTIDIDINSTNVDELNGADIDLTDNNKYFGANSICLNIALESDRQIVLDSQNKDDIFTPADNTIGITSITINPKLDSLTVDPVNDISTENSVNLISKSTVENVLGLDSVILPEREADKTYDVLLSTNNVYELAEGTAEIIKLSASELPPVVTTKEYFVNILGKHAFDTAPMLNEVHYIVDETAEDALEYVKLAEIGDAVYITLEAGLKDYYVYNGLAWIYWNFGEPFFVTETKTAGKTYVRDLTSVNLETSPEKFGCRTVTINNPGAFDFILNTPSKLLNLQNNNEEVITAFNFEDDTHNLTNFIVPKIPVTTKVISEEEIFEALTSKKPTISVVPEETSTTIIINGEEEEIILPTLFNSVILNLPDLENGSIVSSNQNDIAILETQIKNLLSESDPAVDISFDLTTQNKTAFDNTSSFISEGILKNKISKQSYFINTNDIQEFNIKVHANTACTINVYQAPVTTATTVTKEDIISNKLFSFTLDGNTIINSVDNDGNLISTVKPDNVYYITFDENFNIAETLSDNGSTSNLEVSGISIQYQIEDTSDAEKFELNKEEINAFIKDAQPIENRSTTYYYYVECINTISSVEYMTDVQVESADIAASMILYTQESGEEPNPNIIPVTNIALTTSDSVDGLCLNTINYLANAENNIYKNFNLVLNVTNTINGNYYYFSNNDINMLRIDSTKIYLDAEEIEYNYTICKISDSIIKVNYYDNNGQSISDGTFELIFNGTFDKIIEVVINNIHYTVIKDNIAASYTCDLFEILTVESPEIPVKGTIYFPQIKVISEAIENIIA
jgi:hypothetical protein